MSFPMSVSKISLTGRAGGSSARVSVAGAAHSNSQTATDEIIRGICIEALPRVKLEAAFQQLRAQQKTPTTRKW